MWYNAWESIKDLSKLISKNYGMKVYSLEPSRKIIKLTSDQGVKALKIINLSYSLYSFVCEAINHACNNGYNNIPPVTYTLNNKLGVNTKSGILTMTDWLDAREVNYDNEFDVQCSTIALAKLHLASHDFKPNKVQDSRNLWGKWIKDMNHKCAYMRRFRNIAQGKKNKSDFDKKIIRFTDYFYNIGKKSIKHLEKSNYYGISDKNKKKNTFCHNDLGSANILLANNNDVFFIDFDNCILDMTIHDLANYIIKNVQHSELDMDRVHSILKTYNKVNPVSEAEMTIIKSFIEFPHEFYGFGVRYYMRSEKYSWTEEKFNKKLSKAIDNISTLETLVKNL